MAFGDLLSSEGVPSSYRTASSTAQATGEVQGKGTTGQWINLCSTNISSGTWLLIARLQVGYNTDVQALGYGRITVNGSSVAAATYQQNEYNSNSNYAATGGGEPLTMIATTTVYGSSTAQGEFYFDPISNGAAYSGNNSNGYGFSKIVAVQIDAGGGTTTLGDTSPSATTLSSTRAYADYSIYSQQLQPYESTVGNVYYSDRAQTVLALAQANTSHGTVENTSTIRINRSGSTLATGSANSERATSASQTSIGIHGVTTMNAGDYIAATGYATGYGNYIQPNSRLIVVGVGGNRTLGDARSNTAPDQSLFNINASPLTTTGSSLTPTTGGTYLTIAQATFSLGSINAAGQLALYRNGSLVDNARCQTGPTLETNMRCTMTVFDIGTYSGGSASFSASGSGSWNYYDTRMSMVQI